MPDGNNLTEKQLKFGYWFVTHKPQLRKVGYGILIVFNVVFLGYALYGLVDYFLISWNRDLAVQRELGASIFSHQAATALAPEPLGVKNTQIFAAGAGRYDLLAVVQNTNTDWYATFRYRFAVGEFATEEAEGFILPAEEKYVARFAESVGGAPRRAEFELTHIAWHRVNRHVIRDYERWRGERLRLAVANVTHQTSVEGLGRGVSRTSFDVRNPTAFGYWRMGVFVTLLRAGSPVAVNYITLDNLESGESRHLDVRWFEPLPASSTVDIRPEVNLFDPQVYLPPKAQ